MTIERGRFGIAAEGILIEKEIGIGIDRTGRGDEGTFVSSGRMLFLGQANIGRTSRRVMSTICWMLSVRQKADDGGQSTDLTREGLSGYSHVLTMRSVIVHTHDLCIEMYRSRTRESCRRGNVVGVDYSKS